MPLAPRANGAAYVAAATLAGSIFLFWHTFDPIYQTSFAAAGRGPMFFPRIILGLMIALAAAVVLRSLAGRSLAGRSLAGDGASMERRAVLPVTIAVVLTATYVFAIPETGYLLATLAYALLLPPVFGDRKPVTIAGFALCYAVATWFLFERSPVFGDRKPVTIAGFALCYAVATWFLFERVFLIILPKSPWFATF